MTSDRLTQRSFSLGVGFFLLYLLTAHHVLRWPIFAGDTDLWFHLNAGRYITTHHGVPLNSFFSFIDPPRAWVDYAWLFQVLVYRIYTAAAYPGLIVLRGLAYFLAVSTVLMLLFTPRDPRASRGYLALLALLYWFLLLPRYNLVRPHIFTYLFITLFLWVLECRPRWSLCLVLFGVLWCNLHGITYPVMLLICFAYLLEALLGRTTQGRGQKTAASALLLIPTVLAMWTVFATPHGEKLITLPFTSAAYAADYLLELAPLAWSRLATIELSLLPPSRYTLFTIVFAATIVSVIISLLRHRLRVSHLVLVAGGLVGLWIRGERAIYECALLSLPLLRAAAPRRVLNIPALTQRLRMTLALLGLVVPCLWLQSLFTNLPRYPFSRRSLPCGIATFLDRIDATGSVLNFPSAGGYLQWVLYPKYQIFADLDAPFFFTDLDVFTAKQMFRNSDVLMKVLARYTPSFLAVPIVLHDFNERIRPFPDYIPVFFDDAEVLYLNRRHYPEIASHYALTAIDPYALATRGPQAVLTGGDRAALLREARRLLEIDPDGLLTNQLMSVHGLQSGAYDWAFIHADTIIRNFPESPTGFGLKGDALQGVGAFDRAIVAYRAALRRGNTDVTPEIYYQMGLAYHALGRHRQAYQAFKQAVKPFAPHVRYDQLYNLALAALLAGKKREAAFLFQCAELQAAAPNKAISQ